MTDREPTKTTDWQPPTAAEKAVAWQAFWDAREAWEKRRDEATKLYKVMSDAEDELCRMGEREYDRR